jgi:hypothetical protein
MWKKSFAVLAATAALCAPAMAQRMENREQVDKIQPGVAIEMHETGKIPAIVNTYQNGQVFLTTEDDKKLTFSVPAQQPMWFGKRMASTSDLVTGAHVIVLLPKAKEMRVREMIGDRARIGTYEGLINIPVALVEQFDAEYWMYIRERDEGHQN